ncbi:MAG: 30S ribosomal protein S9 [Candidatus Jacksonbacteria bacterium RIFOXYC2_FULL_44_29]|nr:MAG: 30S ribosomal protein S9 [Candidatus Jacksonbacteria bacterium RIFOXYA2_FULL_43_12]OGY75957.1 MAG: 30S ribosomal protein S9 [Candidatus Jacksonbacteria bacterium RIFOXYB2_FULL_44_15]OGY77972.1 MAG: 30S ribosomal protein S9 [Candidatus Jacksonbacteria bacterium RIFOXYC2_FULL_44_29]OGY80560.1 MAG: 30S ribosomal protein S9 [Candidatus Jacksonbacteria bacterium RIFOXYD2_FULL_43_21]HBH45948.1 30S ribosomal protein S9 [Candidatus Jacksonbacteria bacterium]
MDELFKERVYFGAVGRRKCSVSQARIYLEGKGRIYINQIEYRQYAPYFALQKVITKPLDLIKEKQNIDISIVVKGGGYKGQAQAIALALARALTKWTPSYREKLRQAGLLTGDARVKERKKPGLKRARRAPQWAKR